MRKSKSNVCLGLYEVVDKRSILPTFGYGVDRRSENQMTGLTVKARASARVRMARERDLSNGGKGFVGLRCGSAQTPLRRFQIKYVCKKYPGDRSGSGARVLLSKHRPACSKSR
jgi:hypothetical protein